MLGAMIGDIVGSRFEFKNHRSKDFILFHKDCFATDDSIMTLAIAKALHESPDLLSLPEAAVYFMQTIGRPYPDCGYGARFGAWMYSDHPVPYSSYGNGGAMRVSACAWHRDDLEQVKALSHAVTAVTHNHPEGIKGAEATAVATFLARSGRGIDHIRRYVDAHYYPMNFTLDEIRTTYTFNETASGTVPQAIVAFLESHSFEDAIRGAISIGGDSDTLAAITGSIAQAYYGVPKSFEKQALSYLDDRLLDFYSELSDRFSLSIKE